MREEVWEYDVGIKVFVSGVGEGQDGIEGGGSGEVRGKRMRI